MGHRSLVALGKSKKNIQKSSEPMYMCDAHLTSILGRCDTSTHHLTSDFFFFQKKVHGCSSHIPCFKSSCFAASEKQFENFRFRANVDKRLRTLYVGCAWSNNRHVLSCSSYSIVMYAAMMSYVHRSCVFVVYIL